MKVDLLHNKIISETATPQFIRSVNENLTALIGDIYTDATGILMYEDYVNDGFLDAGKWFYPLTVKRGDITNVVWVSWSYAGDYFSRSPYSYEGEELLSFELAEYVPERFIEAIEGRAHDYDEHALKVNVRAEGGDPLILSGRYSQTFIDVLASQITERISTGLAIEGLTRSDISLELVFAPGSYMEHTSESVTYRRLLMVDGASKPRDFWVKWTKLVGSGAFTVSDNVSADEILFELGEDVAHKIREKEYRFLCSSDPSVYQSAMGKRAATEWRDLIKRAVRRGEITKLESELVIKEREADEELRGKLVGVLGAGEIPEAASVDAPEAQGFDNLMDLVRAALIKSEEHASLDDGFDFGEGLSGIDLGIADETEARELEEYESLPVAADEDIAESEDESEELLEDENDIIEESDESEEIDASDELDAADTDELEEAAIIADEESDDVEESENAEQIGGDTEDLDEPDDESDEDVADADAEQSDAEDEENATNREEEQSDVDDDREDTLVDDDGRISLEELLRRVDESFREAEEDDEEEISPVVEKVTQFTTDNGINYDDTDETGESLSEISDEEISETDLDLVEDDTKADEDSALAELEERIRREYEAKAKASAEAEIARLIEEATRLREENERLARAAKSAEEQHAKAMSDHIESVERARAAEEMLERERREREREEARERDRLAEAARIAVEERRRQEEAEKAALAERLAREAEERALAERRIEEERIAREEAERLERERIEAEERAREAERIARENEFISKRAKIIFRYPVDVSVISRIRSIVEQTIKETGKQNVRIHMKAYQEDKDVIVLEVLKMPKSEQELLVSIVKAIGNARIGVTKIILE